MKDDCSKDKEKNLSVVKYSPVPFFVTCPECGLEIELWTGYEETVCLYCGNKVFSREATVH